MCFLTQKPPNNAYLIGLHDHSIYAIAEEQKSGHLVIHRKNVLNVGEWDDEPIDLNIIISKKIKCKECDKSNRAFACGIMDSKLWVMAAGKKIGEKGYGPHIFCVDLEINKVTKFVTQFHERNEYIKQICIICNTLQITFEETLEDGKLQFMVEPNRLQSFPYGNSNESSIVFSFLPCFKHLYFIIDEINQTCEFGYYDHDFLDTQGIFEAGIVKNNFRFGFQILMYDGFQQGQFRGDYHAYALTNYTETEDLVYARFFRDAKNELLCLIKEKFDSEKCETTFKLKIYKIEINGENETASFELKSLFYVDSNFPDIDYSLIFTANNIVAFTSNSRDICISMNRMITLSEIAYLALQKVAFSNGKLSKPKSDSLSMVKKIKGFFQKTKPQVYPKNSINKFGVSLKYLQDYCGIPKNFEIKHGYEA